MVVLDPVESVRQQVVEAAGEADVVVVLSNLGPELDVQLARTVPGIDVIVGSSTGSTPEEAIQVQPTGAIVVQAGKRGEWLGILDLEIDRRGKIVSYEGRSTVLIEEIPEDPDLNIWLESVRPTPTPTSLPPES